jgi:YebC/PmpR family DNA-binding regulatory protein
MAGHSKFKNIQFRKAAQDNKRGKIFTKLIREITVAARTGGGDPATNPRLRDAIKKALSANMKRDTVDNAVKRGVGGLEGDNMEEVRYEGYGIGGIAVIVDCLTDNRNRTVSEVRFAFSKNGGNLGTDGSVGYLFNKQGSLNFEPGTDENKVMEIALEAGADDIITDEEGWIEVVTTIEKFHAVKNALEKAGLETESDSLDMVPMNRILVDKETAENILNLVDMLEDCDDVQNVYTNMDVPDEIMEALSEA